MTLPVYPGRNLLRGIAYNQKWTTQFFNQTAQAADGGSQSIGIAQYPLHLFELNYEFLRDGFGPGFSNSRNSLEFRTMKGFLDQMAGQLGRFLYHNIDDHRVSQQVIGTGDGATTTFTLVRTFGANGYGITEPIGQVIPGALFNVYLAGSSTPVNPTLYTLSTTPVVNTITFTTAPAVGQTISVDMSYYYYCRLGDDNNTVNKFMNRLWDIDKVSIQSCRPGT